MFYSLLLSTVSADLIAPFAEGKMKVDLGNVTLTTRLDASFLLGETHYYDVVHEIPDGLDHSYDEWAQMVRHKVTTLEDLSIDEYASTIKKERAISA